MALLSLGFSTVQVMLAPHSLRVTKGTGYDWL